jgi:hypothetical protein
VIIPSNIDTHQSSTRKWVMLRMCPKLFWVHFLNFCAKLLYS